MNRAELLNAITDYLTHLKVKVDLLNHLNLQDINIHAETFFRDLLNVALGHALVNINIIEKNARAVDLGDEVERLAIQVTSTSDIGKIKHTYNGFVKGGLDSKYDRLVVLIIGEKKAYRESSLGGEGNFTMSLEEDVWGLNDLLRKISDMPLNKLEACRNFLRAELRVSEPRLSNEVKTLIRLIEALSAAEEGLSFDEGREDPDPDKKINDRFADHAEFLKRLYVDLHQIYGRTLAEVNKYSDLGHVRVRKLQVYLMRWSDRVLSQCGGDPEAALDRLTEDVLKMMGSSDAEFDDGAVRYYLIEQLIACNVFPNKRQSHA
ncbi:SMEK domain-containing protein [Rubellimicrobium roseum]|uniref:SMEK domain-containing protein n=1 Tax=Rubellimicrobium roseum TaxID=687525 RepID=A0A5C4N6T8_9RHOB|nr:SMEK domain-containing protein [Rubellimicrobium roseum]TNC67206.1 hypothetical protein FHG71_15695 [Rubellimicrobium roseum]